MAGVRVPELAVPVATHTGWNVRARTDGLPDALYPRVGTWLPFALTEAERLERGDPRPSIAERYRDRDDYIAKARSAAEALAQERYILDEDIDLAVELAVERYDALAPKLVAPG